MRSFDDMDRLFREMNRSFDQLRSTWMREFQAPGFGSGLETDERPALETDERPVVSGEWAANSAFDTEAGATLEETDDGYVYVMDLPGFEKDDIDLTFDDGVLSIQAHTNVEDGSDSYRSVRSRRVGRRVPISSAIIADEIAASYHNGVLEVDLPVEGDHEDDGHHIEIE